jgi:homoaconitase/3-isopropylmalate dehydratase large subunit
LYHYTKVEHVLATQTLLQKPSKNMRISVDGPFLEGVTSKDFILHVIGVIGGAVQVESSLTKPIA